MKRTELKRKTPLRSSSPLRASRLNPVSRKRQRENALRTPIVNAMRLAQSGICPRCGLSGIVLHGHERRARAHANNVLAPDVAICDPCNGAIEDSPRVSCWNGWKVSPKWPHDPALTTSQARALDGSIVEFTVPDEQVA